MDMDSYSPHRSLSSPTQYDSPPGDRFIPNRSLMDISRAQTLLTNKSSPKSPNSPFSGEYRRIVEEELTLDSEGRPFRMLVFRGSPVSCRRSLGYITAEELQNKEDMEYKMRRMKHLPKLADRVLDAPNIENDYYLNLLDWGKNDIIAMALGSEVYLKHLEREEPGVLTRTDDINDYPASVAWSQDAEKLAVGYKSPKIELWNVETSQLITTMGGHRSRVGSLAWNGQLLTSGSRDKSIINHDIRKGSSSVSGVQAHTGEVCGLKWSDSGNQLASGGSDHMVYIWEATKMSKFSQCLKGHQSSVKPLAWCPHRYGVLASGGGIDDRCIKLWCSHSGKCIQSVQTPSQVCGLEWNRHQEELLSGHGYSENQLCLWRYPSMSKITELTGHTQRILCISQSPDGSTVASAGADDCLRIWKVFEPPDARTTVMEDLFSLKRLHIR